MDDSPVEFRRDQFLISTDRSRIDIGTALALLRATHWAGGMSRPVLERAVRNSVVFGVLQDDRLVGLGRAVTDLATYAYWTDVVIAPAQRSRGLGRWLSDCMLAHPDLQNLRRVSLLTRDAAPLYASLGFTEGPGSLIYMERPSPASLGAARHNP
jgi:N-acetylglutamate synthase-like GNAT family acetyltransferase